MGQVRWKIFIQHIILASLPSTYQNLLKVGGNLTKFWQKQICTVFLRHGVHSTLNNELISRTEFRETDKIDRLI